MAVALEGGIRDLFSEFLADTLILLSPLQAAGTIASGTLQTVFYDLDHLLVIIQTHSHQRILHLFFVDMPHPSWMGHIGGECEIRTYGASPHHQFSRLAP